jgi:hypothetical protein
MTCVKSFRPSSDGEQHHLKYSAISLWCFSREKKKQGLHLSWPGRSEKRKKKKNINVSKEVHPSCPPSSTSRKQRMLRWSSRGGTRGYELFKRIASRLRRLCGLYFSLLMMCWCHFSSYIPLNTSVIRASTWKSGVITAGMAPCGWQSAPDANVAVIYGSSARQRRGGWID